MDELVSESKGMGTIELNKIYCGDALTVLKTFPDECVDTCVTSPPYWGLRDYGVEGQIGLEKTPEEYVEKLVIVFREVRRVLKKTGTLWLNLGDTYFGSGCGTNDYRTPGSISLSRPELYRSPRPQNNKKHPFLKPKDLVGIPWMVAFALRDDGWYLRSDIIFAKANPMPESVKDRPTKAHEYIFLMSKSEKYFYDNEAIKENGIIPAGTKGAKGSRERRNIFGVNARPPEYKIYDGKRNKRSVWFIPTEPFPEAHFATFPKALVEPCIKAGTSEKGNCPKCGAPWERIIKRVATKYNEKEALRQRERCAGVINGGVNKVTLGVTDLVFRTFAGWRPTCSCNIEETVPAIVLDPFMGSGTVGLVAKSLGRNYIGIELNPEYVEMAERRINGELFANKVLVK